MAAKKKVVGYTPSLTARLTAIILDANRDEYTLVKLYGKSVKELKAIVASL